MAFCCASMIKYNGKCFGSVLIRLELCVAKRNHFRIRFFFSIHRKAKKKMKPKASNDLWKLIKISMMLTAFVISSDRTINDKLVFEMTTNDA